MSFNHNLLAQWQKELDISGAKAAKMIGISQIFYSELIRGTKSPSIKTLEKISYQTGIPIEELLSNDN